MPWGEPGVRHMLDACKACGWSRIYWRALDGGRSLYKSKLLRPQGGPWDDDNGFAPKTEDEKKLAAKVGARSPAEDKKLLDQMESFDYAHFDTLGAAVRYGHEIGLEIHAWVSINEDDHYWGIRSEFSKRHPQFCWVKRDGQPYHSQMSFAFPEVREYKLGILRELLQGYDIDGIFMDWIRTGDVRDNPQTDPAGVANYGYETPLLDEFKKRYGVDAHSVANDDDRWIRVRAEPQTVFMRAAHELVAKHRRPLAVMVAHPWSYRGFLDPVNGSLKGMLLDMRTWAREGLIDAAVPAGYYRPGGTPEKAYQSLKDETEGRVDLWCYDWVPMTPAEFDQDFQQAKNLGAKHILFWEADYIDGRPNAAQLKAAMHSRAVI